MPSLHIFGDSLAHGGRDTVAGGWPLRLRRHMRQHGLGDALWVDARSGDTSFQLCQRLPTALAQRQAETVLIAIGSNDSQLLMDAAHPRVTDDEFRDNMRQLIRAAKAQARWVIPLAPPLPSPQPRPGPRPLCRHRAQRLGDIVKEVATQAGCWWIDLRPVLQAEHLPDGVHPESAGHALMAAAIWPSLVASGCLGLGAMALPPPPADD